MSAEDDAKTAVKACIDRDLLVGLVGDLVRIPTVDPKFETSDAVFGPIAASFLLTFATEAMVGLGAWRFVIVSALMILVVRFAPGGLASIQPKDWLVAGSKRQAAQPVAEPRSPR